MNPLQDATSSSKYTYLVLETRLIFLVFSFYFNYILPWCTANLYWQFLLHFLGGLSLHLNHLIAWRLRISFQQFGTLPIGIFLVKFGLKTPYDIS